MSVLSILLFLVASLFLSPFNLCAQNKNHPSCKEFQHHLNQRVGLISFAVEEKETQDEDFNFYIPDIDIDGDRRDDKILLFRTGSASIIAPDNSSVTLILSSTGEKSIAEMQRFFIIRYKSKYYIVASNWQGEKGPVFVDIKSMDRRGIKQLCAFKCGLKDGSCTHRQYKPVARSLE